MDVYVDKKRIHIDPTKSKGKGGEADVYDIGGGNVVKIYKTPDHPDYAGELNEQDGARNRITEHQKKLPAFPQGLPQRVIVPQALARDQSGKRIVGYVMPFVGGSEVLLRYSDRGFRQQGITHNQVLVIFRDLYQTVAGVHAKNVVIGDFNDLNVLVTAQQEAYLIDADSFQYGGFLCKVFTGKFVDPTRCNPKASSLMLAQPHTEDSDWYAFNVMLMQCLLFVDPFGGVYRPKDSSKRILHDARPLYRITVFNPEVKYPKPAIPYNMLPDDLLQHFHLVFEKDKRGEFPRQLLESLRWTTCSTCSVEHARNVCPTCKAAAPAAVKEKVVVRGTVTATRIFQTSGVIVYATVQNGELVWLYHEQGQYKRENRSVVFAGDLDPQIRFGISGDATLIGKNGQLVTLQPGKPADRLSVESYGTVPVFSTSLQGRYWVTNGQLLKDGQFGQEYVGDVLSGQTMFWIGSKFGFGFYRAGGLSIAFVFDVTHHGINDSVKLSPIRGQLVDAVAYLSDSRCWFITATKEGAKTIHRCAVIKADGTVEATSEVEAEDGSWLGTIRGKCAAGNFLLAATDEGIVRIEISGNTLVVAKSFPDTEPFVDSSVRLYPGKQGLYVVTGKEIQIIKIS